MDLLPRVTGGSMFKGSVDAKQCVFVDDQLRNVTGAP